MSPSNSQEDKLSKDEDTETKIFFVHIGLREHCRVESPTPHIISKRMQYDPVQSFDQ